MLGAWLVEPTRNRIQRDAVVVLVRPKAMNVLATLAAWPGTVVTKETLLDAVWPGQPTSDSVLSRAVFELREALSDQAQEPRYIETVARRGYRLAAAVTEPDTVGQGSGEPTCQPAPPRTWWRRRSAWVAAALAMLAVGGWLGARHLFGPSPAAASRVGVLPFENLGEATDEFLAAGMADEISSRLAELRAVQVVACPRASARPAGGAIDEIGRRLRVDYLVAGTVRWDHRANRVRITPRVVRIADGSQVWVGAFDRDATDMLAVQGEIAASVGSRLPVAIQEHELTTLKNAPTASPDAYRAYLEGRWRSRRARSSSESLRVAARLQERATTLDPAFAEAWAELGRDHADIFHTGLDLEPEQCGQAASAIARAVELAPDRPQILLASALVSYWCDKDFEKALATLQEAKKLRADLSEVWEAEAWVQRRQGRWQESIAGFRAALDLSPQDPLLLRELGSTLALVRRYREALEVFEQAGACDPNNLAPLLSRAEVYWQLGDLPAARAVLSKVNHPDAADLRMMWTFQELLEGHTEAALGALGSTDDAAGEGVARAVDDSTLRGELLTLLGRHGEARAAYLRALRSAGVDEEGKSAAARVPREVGFILARLGRAEAARRHLDRLLASPDKNPDVLDRIYDREAAARLLVALGDHERAAALVADLLREPSSLTLQALALDPVWAPLRTDARFASLFRS
ncbi:MAG TPA: winged helix-turn-helix domain-containing protein [Thermoanaerobaculaceae bacterium]|nr:winged helix-turn-helix domain-containing protein [Thermoanaerobaculaceae bacterium]